MHDSPVLGVSGDERFLALARFDRGCMGVVYNSAVIPVSRNDYQVAGTLGTLVVENGLGQEDLGVLRLRLAGESEWRTVETRRQSGYVGEIRAFTAAVQEGTPLGIDGVNGRANVAIVLAALEASARRGFAEVR
jgi:predicted dehydrogenase